MKFYLKLFISTIILISIAFSVDAYLRIAANFNSSLSSETENGLKEYQYIKFAFDSAVLNLQTQQQVLDEAALKSTSAQISASTNAEIAVYNQTGEVIYFDFIYEDIRMLLDNWAENTRTHEIREGDGMRTILISGKVRFGDMDVLLCVSKDISAVFAQIDDQIRNFIVMHTLTIVICAVVMFIIAKLLTRPVERLTKVSNRIANGHFEQRVNYRSGDEIGRLSASFNKMADAVEEKIGELEQVARQREEFVASFSHEIKTPLTSIIGYADMLRTKEYDRETVFRAMTYIANEGKRLEALSLKLMDLIMLGNHALEMRPVYAEAFLEDIAMITAPLMADAGIAIHVSAQKCVVLAEPDMMKTLLINLMDNARKASPSGGEIHLFGKAVHNRYDICVSDQGRGIPPAEIENITKAFYMVDKSRSRKEHGAGLGLAIANKIAVLHGTELRFTSTLGKGTTVCVSLDIIPEKEVSDDDE